MKRGFKNQKGFVSNAVAFGLFLMGLLAISNGSIMSDSFTVGANDTSQDRASFYAMAGLEKALRDIDQGQDPVKTYSFEYGNASVTVNGNQITSTGVSDIARVTQTIQAQMAGHCVFLSCNNFHSAGTDLMAINISKTCLEKPTLARIRVSFSSPQGEKITTVQMNQQDIFHNPSGMDVGSWMGLNLTPIPASPSPSVINLIRFASAVPAGKAHTVTVEFSDHSLAQVTCTDSTAPEVCGNGEPGTGEECDDGNANNGDGCSANCIVEPGYTCNGNPSVCIPTAGAICGNATLDAGEACDDGNTNNGDGCSSVCGVEPGFQCAGTPSLCTPLGAPLCGNGTVETGEACDDGNNTDGDGCTASCAVAPGFQCNGSPSACFPTGDGGPVLCGNGIVQTGESCDDKNTTNGDGCSSNCASEPGYSCTGNPSLCNITVATICGNGSMEASEVCDDGNTQNGDGCSFNCTVETGYSCGGSPTSLCTQTGGNMCGNGSLETGESCDDGNASSGDGCSSSCLVESGFSCQGNPKSACAPTTGPVCGNGQVESAEACDDGNKNNGDGCSSQCNIEAGFSCSGKPSQCTFTSKKYCICHNSGSSSHPYNTISISENAVCTHLKQHGDGPGPCPGDSLADCKGAPPLPAQFLCAAAGSVVCGNGTVESGETCDDGNLSSNDGCSSYCVAESGFTCQGSPSVCSSNSAGNLGLTNNGNGTVSVNPVCTTEFKVLCTDITYGAGGPNIPVKMNRAKNGSYFNGWMFNNSPVSAGQTYSEMVGEGQSAVYKIKANASYGNFNATYESINTNQVKTLVNGSPPPTQWSGFGGQQPVSACVNPYTNSQTQKIQLANNQAIFLFELGVNTTQNPNSAAIDFQDLVVLMTAKSCQ